MPVRAIRRPPATSATKLNAPTSLGLLRLDAVISSVARNLLFDLHAGTYLPSFLRALRLICPRQIYAIPQRLAPEPSVQIVDRQFRFPLPDAFTYAAGVRSNKNIFE